MESIQTIRYVGGFARAGSISAQQYFEAKSDPIAPFADPVMKHMNEDHADSLIQMIDHYVQIPVTDAQMVSMDRLGMTVSSIF